MKKFILIIFILGTIGFGISFFDNSTLDTFKSYFYFSPCDKPIRYSIGLIDPRFKITRGEFMSYLSIAGGKWGGEVGQRLFMYDPQGALTMNMLYDRRQMLTSQINSIEEQVGQKKNTLDAEIAQYEKDSAALKQKIADLNSRIDYYNNSGGAPIDEYNKLLQEQQDLKAEADRLNAIANNLNLSAESYNADLDTLQKTIGTFNSALSQKPEEGLYDGKTNTITIYFNNGKEELLHTIMHEMGHALSLEHVVDPKAIMYTYANKETTLSPSDISAVQNLCEKRNIVEILQAQYTSITR